MQIALLHKHYNKNHLNQVKNEMRQLGIPTIKAIWSECYGMWLATEGCHRIRAAKELNLSIKINDITNNDTVIIQIDGENETVNVAELFEELQDSAWQSEIIDFDEE